MASILGEQQTVVRTCAFPARRVSEAVHWGGIEVASIRVCYDGPRVDRNGMRQNSSSLHGPVEDDSDWSGMDEIPDEFMVSPYGSVRRVMNICQLKPLLSLANDHQHNANLVTQFHELSRHFKSWRPVRGDGNCYYRAVLFSWLERSLALGTLENLRSYDSTLQQYRAHTLVPGLQDSIRICHRLLTAWIAKRAKCNSDGEVRALLVEVSDEFNKEQSDLSFIFCLRHLIAEYLRRHAHDPVGSSPDMANVLTYESWAIAVGSKNIDDFCEQHVYAMSKDASDHLVYVCPRVLRTVVRTYVVDRDKANYTFVDNGEGLSSASGTSTRYAGELMTSAGREARPSVFLLLKPGHYDILLPVGDSVQQILDPDTNVASPNRAGTSVSHTEASLAHLTSELCAAMRGVLHCVEDKLAGELMAKRRRLGSLDESLFEGQLSSVLDPLRAVLEQLRGIPAVGSLVDTLGDSLVPSLDSFFQEDRRRGTPVAASGAAEVQSRPTQVETGGVQVDARSGKPTFQAAREQTPQAECCFCMKDGATAVASCSCAYHLHCLLEYVKMEGRAAQDVCCHLHNRPLGQDFLLRHLPAQLQQLAMASHITASIGSASTLNMKEGLGMHVQGVERDAFWSASRVVQNAAVPLQGKLHPIVEASANDLGVQWSVPKSSVIRVLPGAGAEPQQVPLSAKRVPQSGNLGAALGVPCVICFGEDGVLKTLHCNYKVHVSCLKDFWSEKVVQLCRLTGVRCPAEVAGCTRTLDEADLRGVISAEDLATAQRSIRDVDDQNKQLIDELRRQSEEYRPTFRCAICLVDHDVDGCCTLPCQHRFCFESLQYHFDIIVRERRLSKLKCPAEGCGYNLRSEESIHIFQQCLSEGTYHKLLEFLTRDDPHIYECKHPGCEERVFLDDGDDCADLACPRGHRFCGSCDHGPHPDISCEQRLSELERERREEEASRDEEAWRSALDLGWKPCPRGCTYAGGYKAAEDCDHVTCECGFEFCWDCGVERQVPLLHDNRWHKPSCRYHTKPSEVTERPKAIHNCPECKKMPPGVPCQFPADDGYPHSYLRRRKRSALPR